MSMTLWQVTQTQVDGTWNAPSQIGSLFGLQVAAGQNQDGRLEVVTIADGGGLYHSSETAAGSQSFGAPVAFGVQARAMALGRNADGRLELFYVQPDDQIFHLTQQSANSASWNTNQFGGQAKQLALNRNADGRQELFYIGLDDNLYDFWQTGANSATWQGGIFRGKAKKLVLAANGDGHLELIYIGMDNGLYHNWQPKPSAGPWQGGVSGATAAGLGGSAKDIAFALNGSNNIELFYIGTNDGIFHNWQDSNGWHGEASFGGTAQQLSLVAAQDRRLELFYVGMDGFTYHNWQSSSNGPWTGGLRGNMAARLATTRDARGRLVLFYSGYGNLPGGTVAPPAITTGNQNCLLANNGAALQNPSIVFDVTGDIGLVSNGPPQAGASAVTGFSLQMNCYAPVDYLGNWQQYVVGVSGNNVYWQVNNWESLTTIVINQSANFATLTNGKLLAGSKITVALRTDVDDHVNGATFSMTDPQGHSMGSHFVDLASLLKPVELAPIAAFELNLVGPGNSESALLSGGGGTFQYAGATALTAVPTAPDYLDVGFIFTAETANVSYGAIAANPSQALSQSVTVNTAMKSVPPVKGRTRPPLKPPGAH